MFPWKAIQFHIFELLLILLTAYVMPPTQRACQNLSPWLQIAVALAGFELATIGCKLFCSHT